MTLLAPGRPLEEVAALRFGAPARFGAARLAPPAALAPRAGAPERPVAELARFEPPDALPDLVAGLPPDGGRPDFAPLVFFVPDLAEPLLALLAFRAGFPPDFAPPERDAGRPRPPLRCSAIAFDPIVVFGAPSVPAREKRPRRSNRLRGGGT